MTGFHPYHHRQAECGNVLWFILLAIVLLGAITMVLGRSGSSVDQGGDRERAKVVASQLLRYAKSVEAGVMQLKLGGYSENDISFDNSFNAASYNNTNCSDDFCKVFHARGAGLTMSTAPGGALSNSASEWRITGANAVGTSADPVGTSNNDLIILLQHVRESVCSEINKMLSVNSGAIPTETTGITLTPYQGSFTGSTIIDGDPTPFELNGEETGCFYDDNASAYTFYHTLLAR